MNKPEDNGLVLAAPAPELEDEDDGAGLTAEQVTRNADADALCQAYAEWCATRGFFGPPPVSGSLLGKLSSKASVKPREGGPDAPCSSELSALHLAVVSQPIDALDRKVFTLHYLYRVRNVKEAAHALGVSRPHWYRLLRSFRQRVITGAAAIVDDNQRTLERMPHRTGVREIPDDAD